MRNNKPGTGTNEVPGKSSGAGSGTQMWLATTSTFKKSDKKMKTIKRNTKICIFSFNLARNPPNKWLKGKLTELLTVPE